jgi:hypothetical protein
MAHIALPRRLAACGAVATAAIAGCSSGGSRSAASAIPSWTARLGPGVTVALPGSAHAGDDSPGGTLETVLGYLRSRQYSRVCMVLQPAERAPCKSTLGDEPASAVAGSMPTYKHLSVSYTVIDGNKALVGLVGSICTPKQTPACVTNTDPAALFDSGKSFATLWAEAVADNSNSYSLTPMIEINGTWFGYTSHV